MEMRLPDLKHNFSHSFLEGVAIGPRHEITLSIRLLEWSGHKGKLSDPKLIRFGGIINFEEVSAFFKEHETMELSKLAFSSSHASKPGGIYIQIHAERTEDKILIHCSNIQMP